MTQSENTANAANTPSPATPANAANAAQGAAAAPAAGGAKPTAKTQPKKLLLIRFGKMGTLGWFEHNETQVPHTKTHAIIKTSRGLELGQIIGQGNYRSGLFRSTPEQVNDYFGPTETGQPVITETGTFVRFATHEDMHEQQHLEHSAIAEAQMCEKFTREMNLLMKIVDAEHLFGGERIVIYFTSEGRVDFRELVKRLAKEYQTRIELRQIGSRDEARLIGDYETCGQECCCKRYLKILAPVNMRMAKLQKATLDPSKISGHCGRLKCCLRYEDETYQALREKLPRKNVVVSTSQGIGRVVDVQILTQLVVVQFENGDRQAWPVDEVRVLDAAAAAAALEAQANAAQSSQSAVRERETREPQPSRSAAEDREKIESLPQADENAEDISNDSADEGEDSKESSNEPNRQGDRRGNEQNQRQNRNNRDNRDNRDNRNNRDNRDSRENRNNDQGNQENGERSGRRRRRPRRRGRNKNGRPDSNNNNNSGQQPNPPQQAPGA